MGQSASTTAAAVTSNLLQVHHSFRWVLYGNHSQPVSGFLQRYLRRRLIAAGKTHFKASTAAKSLISLKTTFNSQL